MNVHAEFLPLTRLGWRRFVPEALRTRAVRLTRTFYIDVDGESFMMPFGHRSDGSSWPFVLRWLFSPFGSSLEEGILHDFLYRFRIALDEFGVAKHINITRKNADKLWYRANLQFHHDGSMWGRFVYLTRHIMPIIGYVGLRLFGWWAWRCHRINDDENTATMAGYMDPKPVWDRESETWA